MGRQLIIRRTILLFLDQVGATYPLSHIILITATGNRSVSTLAANFIPRYSIQESWGI